MEDSMENEKRLIRVELGLENLNVTMIDLKDSLKDIATSLKVLSKLEEKHDAVSDSLKRVFTRIDANDIRIGKIESALPTIKLASNWVFKVILGLSTFLSGVVFYKLWFR